jgi:hypothetical protein
LADDLHGIQVGNLYLGSKAGIEETAHPNILACQSCQTCMRRLDALLPRGKIVTEKSEPLRGPKWSVIRGFRTLRPMTRPSTITGEPAFSAKESRSLATMTA